MSNDLRSLMEQNRRAWDEATTLHLRSPASPLAAVASGSSTLTPIEIDELGEVAGRSIFHPLCNCGHDTISLARLGAHCRGVDISGVAVTNAQRVSNSLRTDASFECSNIYEYETVCQYDIVYMSKGSIYWLPDLQTWARKMFALTKPGGFIYLFEEHSLLPVLLELEPTSYNDTSGSIDYFHSRTPVESVGLDYIGQSGEGSEVSYEWQWTLGDIVTAVASAGYRLEFLKEWPLTASYRYWDWLVEMDKMYLIPEGRPKLPLYFSLRAWKG